MWHVVAIINLPHFMYLLVYPGFLSPHPLNFYEASASSTHRMDAPDIHKGQTDVSLCPSVCLSVVS